MNWYKIKNTVRSLFLGVTFTLILCFLAVNFYAEDIDKRESHPNILIQFLHRLDQASIDWRLKFRGPRKGSDRVVILAVDEKSLEQEGQWPWPRSKMKDIVENLMSYGAKVIGFDVVWPEDEQSNTVHILKNLKGELAQDSQSQNLVDKYLGLSRTDESFGQSVAKHRENLVLGAYFDAPPIVGFLRPKHGYQNLCLEEIYRTSAVFPIWDAQEPAVGVLDQTAIEVSDEIPEVWAEELDAHFAVVAEGTKKEFIQKRKSEGLSANMTKTAQVELDRQIKKAKWKYCQTWLNAPKSKKPDVNWNAYKETWAEVQEDDESLADLSFEEGVEIFKKRLFNSKLQMIGDWTMSIPEIQGRSKHTGYFNAKQDSDGTIRRSFLFVRSGQSFFPSMSFLTYLVATGQRAQVTLTEDSKAIGGKFKGINKLELVDEEGNVQSEVPVDKEGFLTINYAGRQKMFRHLSAADVLNNESTLVTTTKVYNEKIGAWEEIEERFSKKEFLKDKVFVLGATATGIFDLRVTPFEENFPGVETHANVVDNLLRKDFLKRHANEELYMLLFMLFFGILFSYIVGKFGAVESFLLNLTAIVAVGWIDWNYFFTKGIVVSVTFPFLLLFGVYAILTIFKYFTEERNKKQLKGTFGKYVSPAIVEEILEHPDNIELGGRKEEVTVFFSDVRGFTTISETLSPTDLGDLLNEYLTPMTEIIFENRGTLDKYIGDAIMAFFGAPINHKTHAEDACRAALQNIERLKTLQEELKKKNLPHIDVGIGLNTGDVSVGNMGSNIVRNYTIMGDAVNLGARLEGITKQYGARIILSEYTKARISDDFLTREVDCVRVKGKLEPVRIYELAGEKIAPENMGEVIKWFNDGYQLYHAQKWDEAIRNFTKASEMREGQEDPSSQLYIKRCQDYIQTPPPEDWDGVYVMTTK